MLGRDDDRSSESGSAMTNPEPIDSIEHEEPNPTPPLATENPTHQKADRRDLDDNCDNHLAEGMAQPMENTE